MSTSNSIYSILVLVHFRAEKLLDRLHKSKRLQEFLNMNTTFEYIFFCAQAVQRVINLQNLLNHKIVITVICKLHNCIICIYISVFHIIATNVAITLGMSYIQQYFETLSKLLFFFYANAHLRRNVEKYVLKNHVLSLSVRVCSAF